MIDVSAEHYALRKDQILDLAVHRLVVPIQSGEVEIKQFHELSGVGIGVWMRVVMPVYLQALQYYLLLLPFFEKVQHLGIWVFGGVQAQAGFFGFLAGGCLHDAVVVHLLRLGGCWLAPEQVVQQLLQAVLVGEQ